MKLQFPRLVNPLGSNTYGLNGDVLEKAIRTALIPLSLPSDKARNEAIQAVFSAFQDGMRKGYSGEPDVVGHDQKTGEYVFCDCSAESPKGRTGVCYDREGLDSRKELKPKNTAMDMAAAMGIELLTEEEYQELQELGNFDTKTSSWVKTPPDIRKLGGALYCDRRYGRVFVGHK